MLPVARVGATVTVGGVRLTSAVDRAREAAHLVSAIPCDAVEAWVYGPALGDTIRALLARPALQTLHVVTLSEPLERAIGACGLDDRAWEADPRVTFHHAAHVDAVYGPLVCSPVEVRFAEPDALALRDRLLAVLNAPFNDQVRATMAGRWQANAEANAALGDPHIATLAGTDRRDAIVVGGGPSAVAQYDWMRATAGRCVVIAASTAMLPLARAGIVPDYAVVLDRMPVMRKHFPTDGSLAPLARTTLVYHVEVEPAIPQGWPGPRVCMRDGDFTPGGSVIHAEIDLALQLGARTIHLVGADFCYPAPQTHMPGAPLAADVAEDAAYRTLNGEGRSVPTDPALAQYQRAVEDMIAMHPGVRWVKWGRAGVALRGAVWGDAAA